MKGEVQGAVGAQSKGLSREGVSRLKPLSRTGPAKQQGGENFVKHVLRMCPDPSHISHLSPTSPQTMGGREDQPHFTDEEAKAQRSKELAQDHIVRK